MKTNKELNMCSTALLVNQKQKKKLDKNFAFGTVFNYLSKEFV